MQIRCCEMNATIEVSTEERKQATLNSGSLHTAISLFEEHGTLWIKNVFEREFIAELAEAYQERYTSLGRSKLDRNHANVGHRRFMVTVKIEPPFNDGELFANPIVLQILGGLLGGALQISSFGSVVTFSNADEQPIHLDHPPLFESAELCASLPTYAVTVVIPLVDIDPQLGPTAMWEGSHRSPDARQKLQQLMAEPDYDESIQPLARMGDAYMMDYRLIHGGLPNESEVERPILYLVYGRPWFRDGFNFSDQPPIEITSEQLAQMPPEHRHLFSGVYK